MIEDQSLRLDIVVIAVLILMATTIVIILFFKETAKSLAEEPKEYCDIHPDDNDWCVCEDMIQYVEGEDCEMFLEMSTCNKSRKKTIADLNCTELRDYFENGRGCEGVWPHQVCGYPKSDDRADVLYQMMLKDCT